MANGGLVHGYGTRQIMGAFWDINKQKAERNREITNILINQGVQGRLKDLKAGTPVYEGLKSQYGEQFAQGLANQNQSIQDQRAAASKQAQRKAVVESFDNGTKIFDTAMKVRKMVGEKADPLVSEYLKVAQNELANAGINVEFNSVLSEVELREELGKKTMASMVEKIEEFKAGKIDLMDLKIANTKYKGMNLSGPGHKDFGEGIDKIIANAEKVRAAGVVDTKRKDAVDLANQRRMTAVDLANQRRMAAAEKNRAAQIEAGAIGARITTTAQAVKAATTTRKDFEALQEVKQFTEFRLRNDVMKAAMAEAEKIATLKRGNHVAVDQAIITTFNKMTDPDSVVRESEYLRTASDLALWHRVKGKIEKWKMGGAGLTISDRRALSNMAEKFYEAAESKFRERHAEYQGYIANSGLDPEKYLTTPKWMGESVSTQPDYSTMSDQELLQLLEEKH
ncbi:MAG: hypothetical protein GY774_35755 [Planctomycetes bacterium]|nr:hypothetical protein [Planctomycetota bacterium]